jgi:hypothetical protein
MIPDGVETHATVEWKPTPKVVDFKKRPLPQNGYFRKIAKQRPYGEMAQRV